MNDPLHLQFCWLTPPCEKTSRLLWKESIFKIWAYQTDVQFLILSAGCFTNTTFDFSCMYSEVNEKSTVTLMNETQPLILEKEGLFFKKTQTTFNFGYTSLQNLRCINIFRERYHWTMFSRKTFVEKDRENRNRKNCSETNWFCLSRRVLRTCTFRLTPRISFPFQVTKHKTE